MKHLTDSTCSATKVQSQTDLDAQLAERLMLEEQEAAVREYDGRGRGPGAQQQQQHLPYTPRQNPRRRSGEIPSDAPLQEQFHDFIAPRRDQPQPSGTSAGGGGGGINTAELQEQFSKMADSELRCTSSVYRYLTRTYLLDWQLERKHSTASLPK